MNCIRDDQLYEYIVEKSFGDTLEPDEAERIAQAFLAVARMDKDFDRGAQTTPESNEAAALQPLKRLKQ